MTETSDKKAQQLAQKQAAEKQALMRVIMYQNVFTTDFGKRVLEDMKLNHFFDKPTFIEGGNVEGIAYREGQRAVILRIISMLNIDVQKIKENQERVEQNVQKA
jgi:hypothetical protein